MSFLLGLMVYLSVGAIASCISLLALDKGYDFDDIGFGVTIMAFYPIAVPMLIIAYFVTVVCEG